jgi:hypothetical protein
MNNNDLIEKIKIWVKLDNEITHLKNEENKRKKIQKEVSNDLMKIMSEKQIDEFNLKEGKLKYTKRSVKKPITKTLLLNILSKYYQGNDEKAIELNEYIMDNREEKVVESIKMTMNKTQE